MEKAFVEVVRFNTEDVIATSGGVVSPYANLTAGSYYSTLASEAVEGGLPDSANANYNFYKFRFLGNDRLEDGGTIDKLYSNYIYTWFDNDQWWTADNHSVGYLQSRTGYGNSTGDTSGWRTQN